MTRDDQLRLYFLRKPIGTEIHRLRELCQRQARLAAHRIHDHARAHIELRGFAFEQHAGSRQNGLAQRAAGLPSGFAGNAGAARAPVATAIRRELRVADHEAHRAPLRVEPG